MTGIKVTASCLEISAQYWTEISDNVDYKEITRRAAPIALVP